MPILFSTDEDKMVSWIIKFRKIAEELKWDETTKTKYLYKLIDKDLQYLIIKKESIDETLLVLANKTVPEYKIVQILRHLLMLKQTNYVFIRDYSYEIIKLLIKLNFTRGLICEPDGKDINEYFRRGLNNDTYIYTLN